MKFKKFYIDRWTFHFRAGMAHRIVDLGYPSVTVKSEHPYWYCNAAGIWRSTAEIDWARDCGYKKLTRDEFMKLSKEDIYETEGTTTKVGVDWGERSGSKSEIIVYDEVDDFKAQHCLDAFQYAIASRRPNDKDHKMWVDWLNLRQTVKNELSSSYPLINDEEWICLETAIGDKIYVTQEGCKHMKDKSGLKPIFKEYCIYIHEIESINISGEKPYVDWGLKMPNSGYKLVEHANKLGYNISRDEVCFSDGDKNVTVRLNADGNVYFDSNGIKLGAVPYGFYKGNSIIAISLQDFLKLTSLDVVAGYKAQTPPWGQPIWMSLLQEYKKYEAKQFIQEYLGKPYSYNEENNKKENEKKMMFNNEVRVKLSPIEVGTKELDEKGNVLSVKDRKTFSVASIADAVHEYLTEHKDLKANDLAVCKLAETWYEVE